MNRRIIFLFFVVLLVGFGAWLLLSRPTTNKKLIASGNSTNSPIPKQLDDSSVDKSLDKSAEETLGKIFAKTSDPAYARYYYEQTKIDPQFDWKQPINFYGRVVDESNAVVVGANIHFTWNDISEKGTSDADTTSDNNGEFSLTKRRGKRLYVDVGKNGYYSSGNSRGAAFEYANPYDGLFRPDPNKPVAFYLRKKGEGADLIHGSQLFGFRTNGPLQYLDLLQAKNTLMPPGDLAAQIVREPRNSEAKFNWSVVISVPDGGLFETNEEFMFEAPTDGYQQSIEVLMTTNDLHWVAGAKKRFYFKSRNGSVYGRAEATIYPQYQKAAAIDLDYYVNPSGSRNLEPK